MPTTTSVLSDLYHELRSSGPPVLFISGASGDAGHFAGAAARLADEFTDGRLRLPRLLAKRRPPGWRDHVHRRAGR